MIQSLKTNPKDQDSHVLAFDVESLVVNLLADTYSQMTPETIESKGLTNNTLYQRYLQLVESPESTHKFWSNVKASAEQAAQKIQAKAESVGFRPDVNVATVLFSRKQSESFEIVENGDSNTSSKRQNKLLLSEANMNMEISRLLLSLIHAWGLDVEMDHVCETKLGLLRPVRPVCFGILSKSGHMSLYLPSFLSKIETPQDGTSTAFGERRSSDGSQSGRRVRVKESKSNDMMQEEERTRKFYARFHWELSTAITTTHLLTAVSLARTLMSMNCSSFIPEPERKRRALQRLSRSESRGSENQTDPADMKALEADVIANLDEQAKQGNFWSILGLKPLPRQLVTAS